jgi:hypothetical protein
MLACPRMITEEAPTSQKNVKMGDEIQSSGMPTTKRPMKRFFRVIAVWPIWNDSGAGQQSEVDC